MSLCDCGCQQGITSICLYETDYDYEGYDDTFYDDWIEYDEYLDGAYYDLYV